MKQTKTRLTTVATSLMLIAGIVVSGTVGTSIVVAKTPDNAGSQTKAAAEEHQANKPATAGKPSTKPTAAGKLKSCEKHGQAIMKRSEQLAERAAKMEDVFDQISQRVQDYYTGTLQPSGKTVANYDQLVADIATKKAAVDASMAAAQAAAGSFSCDQDVKSQTTAYRQLMQQTINALKDYRTSVKNLIVAVRSVNGQDSKTASPTPKISPEVTP